MIFNRTKYKLVKHRIYKYLTHLIGRITKQYYFEDFIRVYPNGISFNKFGIRRKSNMILTKNFKNHEKIYHFAGQFVRNKNVADVGCGSGYGCKILEGHGAKFVSGSDISRSAIKFCNNNYGTHSEFILQTATDLNRYSESTFDISISNEVIQYIKEYGLEKKTIEEMKRITKEGGLIIIGIANIELLDDYGFSFDEIKNLISTYFSRYVIFENALVPFGKKRSLWEERLNSGRTGVIISEAINFNETVLPEGVSPELKIGLDPGKNFELFGYNVDTRLLHNTHAWLVVAINDKAS